MITFWITITSLLVLCNIIALSVIVSLKRDLQAWEAVYESTVQNNAKLTTTCENLMKHNKEVMAVTQDAIDKVDKDWKKLFNLYQEDLAFHRHILDQNDDLIQRVKHLLEDDKK